MAIVGGGLAGLTAASYLRRHGIAVRLFEAGPRIAGLAQSFQDADGFTYDFGAHFITNRLAAALSIGALCRDVHLYGESVLLGARVRNYPFGLLSNPRLVATPRQSDCNSGTASPRNPLPSGLPTSMVPLAAEVANPLAEAWSGLPATELSPAAADSIPVSIAETLMLKAMGRFTHGPSPSATAARFRPVQTYGTFTQKAVSACCASIWPVNWPT